MRSVRRNVFETNSSSTHSLSLSTACSDEKIESKIPMGEKLSFGNYGELDFLFCLENKRFTGFKEKLYCILAFLIYYYENKIEYWNNEVLFEKFQKSCHFIWICEFLKEKYAIEVDLIEFSYSGVSMEDDVFEMLKLPMFYPTEYKERIEELLTNSDIVLDYTCENW